MIPVIKEVIKSDDLSIFKTTDNVIGIGFEIEPCDLESDSAEAYNQKLLALIRGLPSNALGRIKLKVEKSKGNLEKSERSKACNEIGYANKKCRLFVELGTEPFALTKIKNLLSQNHDLDKSIQCLKEIKTLVDQSGLKTKSIESAELKTCFADPKADWIKTHQAVSSGGSVIGAVRLCKQKNDPIDETQIARALINLPKPFEISISFRKQDSGKVKLELERRLNQTKNDNDPTSRALQDSTIQTIQQSLNSGAQFVNFEFLVLFERESEEKLNQDLKQALNILNQLADFKIETFGVTPSWLSTLLGNNTHVELREIDDVVTSFLPLWHYGEKGELQDELKVLPLLRSDQSLYGFDLFNQNYSVYNTVIVGTSGKGKSVLTGLLSQCLLNDPQISIIKLDVGGSHKKECEILGGQEYVLELNKPSGINPFSVLNIQCSDSEKIGILSRFLMGLITEQGELSFSKNLRSQIEESISGYIKIAKKPSLQEFYDLCELFPRRNLLRRWVKGGVYENAFSTDGDINNSINQANRLRYYNFSQVFQASDPEFAQAGLSAVLAQFNIETLIQDGRRIVLICDETPFFINSCFDFFKFSTANVRKYGHAVVLITQLSTDLVVNGDTGIIENSPQRFLFSLDGQANDYKNRFNLSDKQINTIKNLKSVPMVSSEVFLQTQTSSKKLTIKVTKEEYWRLTSSKNDRIRLENLRSAVPELSLKEAIRCLAAV